MALFHSLCGKLLAGPVLPAVQPILKARRFHLLDSARGIALLGILLLNISAFGLPSAAYLNPTYGGAASLTDKLTWSILSVSAQGIFLSMFSLLFGVGLQLMLVKGTRWLRIRLGWLCLFGLLHGILLWDGDILLSYALVGLALLGLLVKLQSLSMIEMVRKSLKLYAIGLLMLLLFGLIDQLLGVATNSFWQPSQSDLLTERIWKLTGGLAAMAERLQNVIGMLFALILQYGWQLSGAMLMGAALTRSGWLIGSHARADYRYVGWRLLGIALPLQAAIIVAQWWLEWDYRWSTYFLQALHDIAVPLQGIGYLSLWFGYASERSVLSRGLAKVGRMTLTNYLLQTLIGCTIFYQLGYFDRFDRLTLLLFVPGIWLVNILFSICWLGYFSQGPIEWLWRKLTLAGINIFTPAKD